MAEERDDSMPIICAGGPCACNPEPLADFIDLFMIGDGEEHIIEIMDLYNEMKKNGTYSKKEYLLNLPIPYIENQDSETYDNILSITLGLTENEKELIFSYKDTLLFDDK